MLSHLVRLYRQCGRCHHDCSTARHYHSVRATSRPRAPMKLSEPFGGGAEMMAAVEGGRAVPMVSAQSLGSEDRSADLRKAAAGARLLEALRSGDATTRPGTCSVSAQIGWATRRIEQTAWATPSAPPRSAQSRPPPPQSGRSQRVHYVWTWLQSAWTSRHP